MADSSLFPEVFPAPGEPPGGGPRSAYLHVPFCARRCGYCNFTVVAGRDELQDAYLDALERELAGLGQPRPVETLFLGGGTPTRLRGGRLAQLLSLARHWFPLAPGGEWSCEANPADLDRDTARCLAAAGVNRLSLGGQSFRNQTLAVLERDHTGAQLAEAIDLARQHFPSVALDLIFAVPGQSLADWRDDLRRARESGVQHVSTYGLTFEKGAAFWGRLARGELPRADEELERQQFLAAIDELTAAGIVHYEVSNFARPGHACRHNEAYWAGEEYFAAGPGAARYVAGRREVNHRSTSTWIRRLLAGQSPVAEREALAPEDRAREALVFGLRRMRGIRLAEFAVRFGFDALALGGRALARQIERGSLEERDGWLRLTRQGLCISDSIWPHLLRC